MDIRKLNQIQITDDDIVWVESVMGTHIKFDDSRKTAIRNLESIDIQAFPGSGKTTMLVAKLAILARKWPFAHSGICVLSHNNVAREEIEEKLGNTPEGKKLLTYPHFIGTLHSFFDTFVALPWLRSNGIHINAIDTDYVRQLRWNRLEWNTKAYLERNHKDEKICGYYESWGNIDWNKQGKTRQEILNIIQASQKGGYFTFDEILLLSKKVLTEFSEISNGIQERFPILFIDEAQDTNSISWDLIYKAFPNDGVSTIRQGFGDLNQAIYNYVNEPVDITEFPRKSPLVLNESRRFDNRIAAFANCVAVSKEQMHGTDNIFTGKMVQHTIFLFSREKAKTVIDEFGQLILDTFSDEELASNAKLGCHVVGMVHKKTDETPDKQFPKGIYDYWPDYNSQKATKFSTPRVFIEYLRIGRQEFSQSNELSFLIDWLAKGMRRVINRAIGRNYVAATSNPFSTIEKLLPIEKHQSFRQMMLDLSLTASLTEDEWDAVIRKVESILSLFDLSINPKVRSFLKWEDESIPRKPSNYEQLPKINHYIYQNQGSGRYVELEFGSIHSVKGCTHLATLVLETFSKAHNMKSILKYLCGTPSQKTTDANSNRLKCQYVAMSRATALLCLAIPLEFVDDNAQKLLSARGWALKIVN